MLAVLENPEIRQRATPVSVEMYHQLFDAGLIGERTELLDGVIVDKMSKSPLHAALVRKLYRLAQQAAGPGLLALKEDPLTFAEVRSEPEPDVAVVEGNEEDFESGHPVTARLVIEVSVSTEGADRTKALIYARAGVPEYWLVAAERAEVEVFCAPSAGGYTDHKVLRRSETIQSAALPTLRVAVDDLFPAI